MIRSRPTGEFGGKFKLTGGEDGQAEARLVVNTAITDNVALKVFGTKIEYDGFMTNVTTVMALLQRTTATWVQRSFLRWRQFRGAAYR